ncbi:MAG: hypothetical protein A3F82_05315 [Deltaproteobacteria bacterium RIFCSPLOWO2_12_FULL_44_12]|nr:MAG: hypothetical protein A2712_01995 [Deltaproteobacteria bacterium RIFCSPHIGHO2_01_FULL_43_49]OGQ15102.1 MAG: hypothetical protein A3D22_03485 [Deltaproteobacteria bacterium RIFCSPHIGHO2_02_FULL_44_53]OGQ27278.1 MAG: hypothetical protein A3D98_02590 [Deltaproteobacteria bacterium RIFCSPHIGHO2_12_FULL_44_21]OGQ31619.1 MAG: hypothetical protein A2979_04645 [Deltaproteobacteria bacterium RIFCSPLOWO2_01_FULL_45_74]OGQ42819.1 MAG: hypothetical protein A3I70_06950 [Deltaproteobacteria bacterium 
MNPQKLCHQVCKKSGSNFVYTFYLLGRKKRLALEVFYAFCREVDDSVDKAVSFEQAKEKLRFWRQEVLQIYEGHPKHLISKALSQVVRDYKIPKQYLEEIIAGCEMDLTKKNYATFQELEVYCYKVASCVGLVCLHIFGVPLTPELKEGAITLGKALQLTNILRDIVTDLGRERIYLPQEDLKKFSVTLQDLSGNAKDNLNLYDLLYFEMERARNFYKAAWKAFPRPGKLRRQMIAAFLMGKTYEALLSKISRNPLAVFKEKVSLGFGEKLKIALKEILYALGLPKF